MAQSCDGHGGVIKGRYCLCYPALLDNGQRYFRKRAYCAQCLMELIGRHRKDWLIGGALAVSDPVPACTSCGSVVESDFELKRFYLTAYPIKDQRVDYEAWYCESCADLIKHELGLEATNGHR